MRFFAIWNRPSVSIGKQPPLLRGRYFMQGLFLSGNYFVCQGLWCLPRTAFAPPYFTPSNTPTFLDFCGVFQNIFSRFKHHSFAARPCFVDPGHRHCVSTTHGNGVVVRGCHRVPDVALFPSLQNIFRRPRFTKHEEMVRGTRRPAGLDSSTVEPFAVLPRDVVGI